jgi:predicted NBD/HSP70 family sugar kinase
MYRLGIDIGGTKVNIGILQEDGARNISLKIRIPDQKACSDVLRRIAMETEGLLAEAAI